MKIIKKKTTVQGQLPGEIFMEDFYEFPLEFTGASGKDATKIFISENRVRVRLDFSDFRRMRAMIDMLHETNDRFKESWRNMVGDALEIIVECNLSQLVSDDVVVADFVWLCYLRRDGRLRFVACNIKTGSKSFYDMDNLYTLIEKVEQTFSQKK